MTTPKAPDIAEGYPSRGERIGPAWQTTWERLADREWHRGSDIAVMIAEVHGLAVSTIKSLLSQAARNGVIEGELRFKGKVGGYKLKTHAIRQAWYRRPQ